MFQMTFSTTSSRPSSRRGSTCDDTASETQEPYFQMCSVSALSRSPSQSARRRPRKMCKDLSHYNSVPPIGHMSRSSSNSFSPSMSIISPSDKGPKSPRSYQAPKSPQEGGPKSPRIGNRSPSEPKSPRYTPKSPLTPTSNSHFNFPPSPSYTTKQRNFSFSGGPKSPLKSPKSRMARSPSTESANDTRDGVEESTMVTSISRYYTTFH